MKKILLHSCCAPCSSSVIERVSKNYEITVLFYNPNIEPELEYIKRKDEQIKFLNRLNVPYLNTLYENEEFKTMVANYQDEPENGKRCQFCFEIRLAKTVQLAKEKGFDTFGTTLTVSPYKNSEFINQIGLKLADKNKIEYLNLDFKKDNGYQRSIEIAKAFKLYRQNYCGCITSKGEK